MIPCKSHLCASTCVLYHSVQTVSISGCRLFIYVRCVKETKRSVMLDLSQSCLSVCVVVCRVRYCKLFFPECLQLRSAIRQSSMNGISFFLFQLLTEQYEAWNANNERDSPQAQSQTQVCYPEKQEK